MEGCAEIDGLSLGDDEGAPDTDGSVETLGTSEGWLEGAPLVDGLFVGDVVGGFVIGGGVGVGWIVFLVGDVVGGGVTGGTDGCFVVGFDVVGCSVVGFDVVGCFVVGGGVTGGLGGLDHSGSQSSPVKLSRVSHSANK